MNMTNLIKLAAAIILTVLISACGGGEADEAKKLGFASVDEMKDIHAKGWHTKARYDEDSYRELGFNNVVEMKNAETRFNDKLDKYGRLTDAKLIAAEIVDITRRYDSLSVEQNELKSAIQSDKITAVEFLTRVNRLNKELEMLIKEVMSFKTAPTDLKDSAVLIASGIQKSILINKNNILMVKGDSAGSAEVSKQLEGEQREIFTKLSKVFNKYYPQPSSSVSSQPTTSESNINAQQSAHNIASQLSPTDAARCWPHFMATAVELIRNNSNKDSIDKASNLMESTNYVIDIAIKKRGEPAQLFDNIKKATQNEMRVSSVQQNDEIFFQCIKTYKPLTEAMYKAKLFKEN
jgi:hypothetical protein